MSAPSLLITHTLPTTHGIARRFHLGTRVAVAPLVSDCPSASEEARHAASGYAPETVTLAPETAIGDWPTLDLATYASYHGAYRFGLSIASRDGSRVSALEAAINRALAFLSDRYAELVRDQARLLSGGLLRAGRLPVWSMCADISPVGQPVIVHIPYPKGSLTLFGVGPTYAACPRHAYRLLAQAIYHTMAIHTPWEGLDAFFFLCYI